MPYKIRKIKCKKADGSSGTHVVYKKSGKRVGCTDEPEDYKKALYAAELNEQEENEEAIIKDVEDEVFLHFTTRERAEKIKDMEMLLKSPQDIQKFGTDTIDAVSLIWGEFVPTVQVNHILGEDIVAVKFRTHYPPKYGFVEEVKWDQEELPIYDIDIISFEEAEIALKNTLEKYDDMQQILYKEPDMRKLKLKDPLPSSKYQKKVRKGHKKKKKELIGSGDGPESSPFTQDPPFERSKSAPPLGEGKKKKKKKRKVKIKKKKKGKDDRCTRIAKRKYDVWPCVPLHTEALTRKGWVVYEDLNVGDEILSYDRTSDTLKWTPVKNVHFFDDAEVFSIQKQHHKIECTMNHKWLTLSRAYKKQFQERNYEKRSTARQYFGLIQDVVSGKTTLTEAREETGSTNFRHFVKKYKGLNFFEFCQEAKVARGAIANLKELGEINFKQESLLTAAPLDSSYPPSDIGVVGKYSDNWIEKILSMSYEQVKAFFASAIIYDGHQSRDLNTEDRARHSCNSYTFKQKDEMHSDIFELAAFLAGYNVQRGVKSSNGCTNFSIRENRFVSLEVAKLVEEPVQSVWCPETQYGTWVMRQNGRIMISGNSAYASGAVVKCRQGKIWKGITEELDKKEKSEIKKIQKELGNASESHKKLADIMSELENELDALEDKFEVELEKAAEKMKAGSKAHADQVKRLDKIIQEEVEAFLIMEKKKKKKKAKKKVKTDFSKEKDKGLHGWFERQGGKGKSKGWVDCNTCRKDKKTGKKTCKTCGRQEGEKRAKYPSCRPTPAACGTKGKGKSWGKKSAKKGKKK